MGNYGDIYRCKRGQIFWLREEDGVDKFSPTINVGGLEIQDHRVRGTRPVVIISNDKINWSSDKVLVCPIRTPKERLSQRRFRSQVLFEMNGKQRVINVDDMKAINVEQLENFIGTLGDLTMRTLNDSIAFVAGLVDEENTTDSTNEETPMDGLDNHDDEIKEEDVSQSPVKEIKEKTEVAPPKPEKATLTKIKKVRSSNDKWTDDLAIQFLIDYEELTMEDLMYKYSLGSKQTVYTHRWKLKKGYKL